MLWWMCVGGEAVVLFDVVVRRFVGTLIQVL